jgi:hypothetical protein
MINISSAPRQYSRGHADTHSAYVRARTMTTQPPTWDTQFPASRDANLLRFSHDVGLLSAGDGSELVVGPPSAEHGSWAGAPSALFLDGSYWLAYRLRRPVGQGRGFANVVARSVDGVTFETVAVLHKEMFGAESLERPTLIVTDDGMWRLYLSCSTPRSYHWRVDMVEAASPEQLPRAELQTVLPGSHEIAVKDPVIMNAHGRWHLWASCHPLTDLSQTDRMTTEYATSDDGVRWTWRGTALAGRRGLWDERGGRLTFVQMNGSAPLACYDGRATAEENFEERTGIAVGRAPFGTFSPVGDEPVAESPHAGRGLRYVSLVEVPGAGRRYYYEYTRPDSAHELRTMLVPA